MQLRIISVLFLYFYSVSVLAGELQSYTNVAEELVRIRQEIETLHSKINDKKATFRDQMRAYANQKTDLNVKISRANLNIKSLQRDLQKLVQSKQKNRQAYEQIAPVIQKTVNFLDKSLQKSIPFKRKQRLQELHEIQQRLDGGLITPNKAANQLWAFVEDELMMGRSSGLYRDSMEIDGEEKLVKVLRIGKIAMFYQMQNHANQEVYGMVVQRQGDWKQFPLDQGEQRQQLQKLFDFYNKNIRNGLFELPDFLPQGEG